MGGRNPGLLLPRLAVLLAAALGTIAPAYAQSHAQHEHAPAESHEAAASMYSCPMHASVRSAKPGTCPKCKMALRPSREGQDATGAPGGGARGGGVVGGAG